MRLSPLPWPVAKPETMKINRTGRTRKNSSSDGLAKRSRVSFQAMFRILLMSYLDNLTAVHLIR